MSFEADGTLNITVPQRQLDKVQQQIEDTVGTTEVGLTDGGTMSAQTARGGGGRARRRARQSYRMEQTRTDLLEESVTYLEDIEDHLAEGVGGGGGVVDDMLGAVVETGGDAAVEGSSMLADLGIETLGTSIGSAVGTSVSDAISGSSVSVSKPSWIPLEVDTPEPIGVEEPPQAGFESEPGPVGFKDLPGPVGFEDIPGPVGFEELPGPVGFEELPGPIAVEDVDPLPVEDVEPIDVEITVKTSGSSVSTPPPPSTTTDPSGSGPTPNTGTSDGGPLSMLDMMMEGTKIGGPLGTLFGASGYAAKVLNPEKDAGPIVDGDERGLFGSSDPSPKNPYSTGQTDTSQPNRGQSSREVSVTVNLDSRNDVVVEPDSADIADEVVSEVEDSFGDIVDELENDLRDAEADIDQLQRALRRSG